jgi:pimeloyl-ACP methyl ester carboxylesterase
MRTDLHVTLADGTVIGYAEAGDAEGPPVLHMHGSPGSRLEVTSEAIRTAAEQVGVRLIAVDRPGIGLSTFVRYSVADFPRVVAGLADVLGIERFALTALSGGGRYGCACACWLSDRVTRTALISTTCSFDLPGARATWSKEDRQAYTLAGRAPWLFRLYFARLAPAVRRDASVLFSMFPELGSADQQVLESEDGRQMLQRVMTEAFRQGARGPAHDYTLEARPWGIPLDQIQVPVEIWYGDDDRLVSPEQGRILANAIPDASLRGVPGDGHLLLYTHHAEEIVRSVVS